ncbi:MAG TPA: enoyl-CoA hydratase-related protein [Myxococcaceae bacterium]|nr:enoyl-CoA hydratase-related protein [Myxococcaceae bacterium]
MTFSTLNLDVNGAVATLTVNRPKALNALSSQVLGEIDGAVADLERQPGVRALIVTGAGEKAFVAGADIAEMAGLDPAGAAAFVALGQRVFDRLEALPFPTVAAVNGYALGGGLELALACDLIYASDRAKFGLPEVGLGIIPGFGGTQRLARWVGLSRAKEMIFTGDTIDAAQARAWGLALEVLPPEKLISHCAGVIERCLQKGPLAISRAKRAVSGGADLPLREGLALEREAFSGLFDSADRREGMNAFLEKRPPVYTGR